MLKKVLIATAAAGLLSACAAETWDVETVEALPGKGGAFERALQKEYVGLAKTERYMGDWKDAAHFVAKARAAAEGQMVLPDEANARPLPDGMAGEVTAARAALMKHLDATARTKAPEVAAKAQAAGFDCWVEQLEENHQPKDIAACKAAFDAAMKELDALMVVKATPTPPAPMAQAFVVRFASSSAKIDAAGQAVLAQAAEAYKKNQAVTVVVAGHTDTAGGVQGNILLSQKRAEAVANGLAALGIDPKSMALEAYGEEKPAVKTADGVVEPANRRVEVILKEAK